MGEFRFFDVEFVQIRDMFKKAKFQRWAFVSVGVQLVVKEHVHFFEAVEAIQRWGFGVVFQTVSAFTHAFGLDLNL